MLGTVIVPAVPLLVKRAAMGLIVNALSDGVIRTPMGVLDLETGEVRPVEGQERIAPVTAVPPGDAGKCPRFLAWVEARLTSAPGALAEWVAGALQQRSYRHGRRLLMPSAEAGLNFIELAEVLQRTLGGYVHRWPLSWWSEWPEERGHRISRALYGTRLGYLTAPDWWHRFPEAELLELLHTGHGTFWVPGSGWMEVPIPRWFVLPVSSGRRGRQEPIEALSRLVLRLPPPTGDEARPALAWLDEEAPHILAWFLTRGGEQ